MSKSHLSCGSILHIGDSDWLGSEEKRKSGQISSPTTVVKMSRVEHVRMTQQARTNSTFCPPSQKKSDSQEEDADIGGFFKISLGGSDVHAVKDKNH